MEIHAQNIAAKVGLNPATIIAIIEAILAAAGPIIQQICPAPPAPAEIFGRTDTAWGQFAILRGLRSSGFGLFHPKHAALRAAITEESKSVSAEDAAVMMAMVG